VPDLSSRWVGRYTSICPIRIKSEANRQRCQRKLKLGREGRICKHCSKQGPLVRVACGRHQERVAFRVIAQPTLLLPVHLQKASYCKIATAAVRLFVGSENCQQNLHVGDVKQAAEQVLSVANLLEKIVKPLTSSCTIHAKAQK
jgi:hypothetical protein